MQYLSTRHKKYGFSNYNVFVKENYNKLKLEHPEKAAGSILKMLGEMWKKGNMKEIYEARASNQKVGEPNEVGTI